MESELHVGVEQGGLVQCRRGRGQAVPQPTKAKQSRGKKKADHERGGAVDFRKSWQWWGSSIGNPISAKPTGNGGGGPSLV